MNKFKELRKKHKLTLDQLGNLMSFSRSYVSLVENNKAQPSAKYINDFINTLGETETLRRQLFVEVGLTSDIKLDELEFQQYLEAGMIEGTDINNYKILPKPYYNLHWLLNNSESQVVYSYDEKGIVEIDGEDFDAGYYLTAYELDNKAKSMIREYINSVVIPYLEFQIKPKDY
ncbi:helix-turn-helix transcriptional regulator [Staphylococcus xylosus]|uniref:helix-turn-helix domain-containing protein n=1 Tax=Staphylococcus xylosus TaxID=1288 RepID=UPI002DB93D36|nr:helix-turn-helix transcriptional regulator [Staphylococcus xylosus]MEB7865882.1 helix-turn-helix transcriptional regulator [Staphylococcus xylosus]